MRHAVLAALLLPMLALSAHADGDYPSPTQDRVRISLGVMDTRAATTLQVDSGSGTAGSVIDGENTLGLDHTQVDPRFQVEVRAGDRTRLRLDYFSLDRNDTKTLTGAPLDFGNAILLVGDPVQTELSVRAFGLTVGHSFVRNDTVELALTTGVSEMDVYARVQVATATRHVDVSDSFAGPFPTAGLEATWVLSKRFYLDGHAQYLKLAVNKLSGSLSLYELNALYRLRPNISFALGYSGTAVDLASRRPGQAGFGDITARGPQFLVRVAF